MLVAGVADHRADELAAEPSVAMLATQAPPVFSHQVRDVGGDVTEHLQAVDRAEVEQRPEVELAGAGVGVVDAVDCILLRQEPVEVGDVGGEVVDGDGGVLDDLARLFVAGDVLHEPLPGPAQLPHLVGIVAEEARVGMADPRRSQGPFGGRKRALDRPPISMADLDDENGAGITDDEAPVARLLGVVLRALEDLPIDQLAAGEHPTFRRRRGLPLVHDDDGPTERLVDTRAVRHEQPPWRRQLDQPELELHPEKQRPLRAGDKFAGVEGMGARRIEAVGVHEGVEGVAGVAPGDGRLRKAPLHLGPHGCIAEQVAEPLVDPGLERVGASALRRELRHRFCREGHLRAVGEEAAGGAEMVTCRPPSDRV